MNSRQFSALLGGVIFVIDFFRLHSFTKLKKKTWHFSNNSPCWLYEIFESAEKWTHYSVTNIPIVSVASNEKYFLKISCTFYNSIEMQCIRANRRQSSASSSMTSTSSHSTESLIKYLEQSLNRKSFLRRSFDLVRRSFVRQSRSFSPKGSKTEKFRRQTEGCLSNNDQNNNRHSAPTLFTTSTSDTFKNRTYVGNVLSFSTDCDIFTSNRKKTKQQSRERWVFDSFLTHNFFQMFGSSISFVTPNTCDYVLLFDIRDLM